MITLKSKDTVVDTGELTDILITYPDKVTLMIKWEKTDPGELVFTDLELMFLKFTLQGVNVKAGYQKV